MESLAVIAMVVLLSAFIGGPTALLLTFLPDKPLAVRIARTFFVVILSLVGSLFGFQLLIGSGIPFFPKFIGLVGLSTSLLALLYEFKILKRRSRNSSGNSDNEEQNPESDIAP